ncbi:unnamed protein product [Urochloa decumbens]|uniref:Uncharacterized protein n=1 Tax=Urochloa decumbens TaxID=240449 RepID=A0ABC9G745_9POAL
MVPNRDAMMIFAIIDVFLRSGDTVKRSPVLESFPQSFDYIPWRRVYKQLAEAQSSTAAYPIMEHWDASELSFGGAGPFWCFTELQRSGENVSRKTEDGQTWVSKNGRAPKNGFPDQIRFDKLVISSKVFHMIELTLSQDKPTIALCKIWRKGNSEAASPQTPKSSVFSSGASAASLQVLENHFRIHEGPMEMQIDQPQGPMDGIAEQHMPSHALPVESNIVVDFTKGEMEGIAQQQYMPGHALPMGIVVEDYARGQLEGIAQQGMPDHALAMESNIVAPDSTRGCVSSIEPDEDSTYQNAVSFLDRMKGSFKQVAIYRKDEARRIASTVQNAASSLKNMFKSLGINAEPESTRPCTSNNTQVMEAASTAVNPAEIAPEMTAQDEFLDQLCSLENSFFDVEMFLNLEGGNGADVDQDEAV